MEKRRRVDFGSLCSMPYRRKAGNGAQVCDVGGRTSMAAEIRWKKSSYPSIRGCVEEKSAESWGPCIRCHMGNSEAKAGKGLWVRDVGGRTSITARSDRKRSSYPSVRDRMEEKRQS